MEGMEIINTAYPDHLFARVVTSLFILIFFSVLSHYLFYSQFKPYAVYFAIFGCFMSISALCPKPTEYMVLFNENMNYETFQENYIIINVDYDTYTIREKTEYEKLCENGF